MVTSGKLGAILPPMPTYIYETIPEKKGGKARVYEIKQSIKDAALTKHPETGEPIERIISGGIGYLKSSSGGSSGGHCHTSSCGCGH